MAILVAQMALFEGGGGGAIICTLVSIGIPVGRPSRYPCVGPSKPFSSFTMKN